MTALLKSWIAVLVVASGTLGYWNYELYQANVRQSRQIDQLEEQAAAVENVRADVMAQVEEALGDGAARLMAAAGAVEGRIATLEDEVQNMQGLGWGIGSRTLADLDADLSAAEGDVDDLWTYTPYIDQLRQRVQTLELCIQNLGRDFNYYC